MCPRIGAQDGEHGRPCPARWEDSQESDSETENERVRQESLRFLTCTSRMKRVHMRNRRSPRMAALQGAT